MNMEPAIILGIIGIFFLALVKMLSDSRLRNKLIDKGMVDENVKYLYTNQQEAAVPSSLKWGMVLIGVGAAFLIGQLVPSHVSGEVTVGSMFIFAGLGLLIYYAIAKNKA